MNHDDVAAIGTDPEQLEVFYRTHVEAVQRFVARRVDDPHTAADLTADVFVAVIEAADRYRPALGPPRAWVFGIARHVVAGEHRARTRGARAAGRVGGRRELQVDALERAVERLDAESAARALGSRLAALPERLRAVIELVAVDGLSTAEAASVLGISTGNARVRLHRARVRLAGLPPPVRSTRSHHPSTVPGEAAR